MVRTPLNVRDKDYRHSEIIRALTPSSALGIALTEAAALRSEVELDLKTWPGLYTTYASAAALGPRKWLMDTGTGFDIVSSHDVSAKAGEHKIPADELVSLNAVGGITEVEWMLPMNIQM